MYGGGYTKEEFEEKFMQINKLTYVDLKKQNEGPTYIHDNGWEILYFQFYIMISLVKIINISYKK